MQLTGAHLPRTFLGYLRQAAPDLEGPRATQAHTDLLLFTAICERGGHMGGAVLMLGALYLLPVFLAQFCRLCMQCEMRGQGYPMWRRASVAVYIEYYLLWH